MLRSCWFLRTRHHSEHLVGPEPPSVPRISTHATRGAGTTWDGRKRTRNARGDRVLPEPPVDAVRRLTMPSNCAALQAGTAGIRETRSSRGQGACRRSSSGASQAVDSTARRRWNSSGAAARRAGTTITSTTVRTRGHATHSQGVHAPATPPGLWPAQKGARSGSPQPFAVRPSPGPCATVPRPRFDDCYFQISQRWRSRPRTPLRSRSYLAVRGK